MKFSDEVGRELKSLRARMSAGAFDGHSGVRGLDGEREAFVAEDFEILHAAMAELPEPIRAYVRLRETVAKQLARGERCAVCGMTEMQAEAANYDCVKEC